MATYSVVTLPAAERQILEVPFPFRRQLVHALVRMKNNPRPAGSEPIELDVHRLILHGWRIVYVIDDDEAVVTVVRVVASPPP
jgi:mRNA-degrading endonuclease RelE of RelBE toxin-antitoxin system